MGDFKSRIRTKLFRRSSTVAAPSATEPAGNLLHTPPPSPPRRSTHSFKANKSASSQSLEQSSELSPPTKHQQCHESSEPASPKNEDLPFYPGTLVRTEGLMSGDLQACDSTASSTSRDAPVSTAARTAPELRVQEPTPDTKPPKQSPLDAAASSMTDEDTVSTILERKRQLNSDAKVPIRDSTRKSSLIANTEVGLIRALLSEDPNIIQTASQREPTFSANTATHTRMLHRKVWVKRPTTSATLVLVREDDMVDEAKDAILQKFRNSLGKHFDAPDVTIRIVSRDGPGERILSPDEKICWALDTYYPDGQSIAEALVIDVPLKNKTPKPSPRAHPYTYYFPEETRPQESGTDYFPPMPPSATSPAITNVSHDSRHSHAAHERAMSVLNTGQIPPLPSPGSSRRTHLGRQSRPNYPRQHTSSPTALPSSVSSRQVRPRLDSTSANDKQGPPQAPPLPTPPAADATKSGSSPGTPRVSSPRPYNRRKAKQKAAATEPAPTLPPGIIDTAVPPINVLIVEDNHINMKLLEQFVRRLKVRWDTAVNGREAVNKWRKGGFHLVLMDIQLPIMSGLEATKEIRRLERINNIGAFSNTPAETGGRVDGLADGDADPPVAAGEEDRLGDAGRLFKSPVIIVALTASNLQSDRHEALAAGCNDFLTKPVNFVWFERKVKEWGCMQALIDFDGWRKWKDFAAANGLKDASSTPSAFVLQKPPLAPANSAATIPAAASVSSPNAPVLASSSGAAMAAQKNLNNAGGADAARAGGIDGRVLAGPDADGEPRAPSAIKMPESSALAKEDSPDTIVGVSMDR